MRQRSKVSEKLASFMVGDGMLPVVVGVLYSLLGVIGTSAPKSELSETGGVLADHLLLHGMRWHAFLSWTCITWFHLNGLQIREGIAILEHSIHGMA